LKHGDEDTVEILKQVFSPMLNAITPELLTLIRDTNVERTYIPKELFELVPRARGSNNWAVSGAKTQSGAALSASDPHLEVNRLPGFWYEMVCYGRNSAAEYQAGITLPGIPGVMMGRSNKYVADWHLWCMCVYVYVCVSMCV
jgi:penicillin G amidase